MDKSKIVKSRENHSPASPTFKAFAMASARSLDSWPLWRNRSASMPSPIRSLLWIAHRPQHQHQDDQEHLACRMETTRCASTLLSPAEQYWYRRTILFPIIFVGSEATCHGNEVRRVATFAYEVPRFATATHLGACPVHRVLIDIVALRALLCRRSLG